MAVSKVVENVIPQYKPIPSDKPGVKRYEQLDLIKEVSETGKVWVYKPTGKIIARGPLDQDTFTKEQSVDLKGEIVNKDGVINN